MSTSGQLVLGLLFAIPMGWGGHAAAQTGTLDRSFCRPFPARAQVHQPQNGILAASPEWRQGENAVPAPSSGNPGNSVFQANGSLPDSPSAYVPLTGRDKFHIAIKRAYSPYTFASVAFDAGWAHATGQWSQYGGGLQGWGKRYGATLADVEARNFLQSFVLATLLHQDPRYFPSRDRGVFRRAWYAGTRVLITRSDNGASVANTSELIGVALTSSLQNAYYPSDKRGLDDTFNRYLGALESDATANLLREFWPDIKQLFQRHSPKPVRSIGERLPAAVIKSIGPSSQ